MRSRLGIPFYLGCFMAVCTLFFAYLSIRNFRDYFSMRSAEVRVLASSMKIQIFPAPDSDSSPYLGYLLQLQLQSTDATQRLISWDAEAGKAAYPEEALDELAAWAPGTIHRIQFLRNSARAIRIEELERSPELESAIGALIAIAIFGLGTLFCYTAANEMSADQMPAKPGKRASTGFFGPWLLFVAFGMLPLIGWVAFTASFLWKVSTWIPVSANVPAAARAFDLTSLPANVEITESAKEKLQGSEYRLFTFPWNGKTLHGGIGYLGGEFDDNTNHAPRPETLNFHISPVNRWALQVELGKGEDFWVPFGVLLLFGLAFTGAGLAVRKLS
jgi:hypothetical protein